MCTCSLLLTLGRVEDEFKNPRNVKHHTHCRWCTYCFVRLFGWSPNDKAYLGQMKIDHCHEKVASVKETETLIPNPGYSAKKHILSYISKTV